MSGGILRAVAVIDGWFKADVKTDEVVISGRNVRQSKTVLPSRVIDEGKPSLSAQSKFHRHGEG